MPSLRERTKLSVSEEEAAKRCLVAIIEDDREFRDMLRELLEEEQYRVVALSNGAEALETLRGDTLPNVILLDVSMPVMDGFDFLRFRNDDPALAAVPVVLVTNAKPHERPTIGVNDVVRKPIDIDEILFAIKRYCS
ncbi:MAG TPA: response regulator [Gemmatimonadales bacterium]|jgi:CheY-like chemotaxis protein|nr:response regulator [Gemmatimonadales bacterium]